MMIDVAIIGSGPAGLSAAITCMARNKKAVVFGRVPSTSDIYKAEWISNYLGFDGVTGKDMLDTFYRHAIKAGVKIIEKRVAQIMDMGTSFSINASNEFYEAKTVIIATGATRGKQLPGESEYLGKGVSYCATCDGMLYRNKTVAVIAQSQAEGIEDAAFLSEICQKVYYVPLHSYDASELESKCKMEIINKKPAEVIGGDFAAGILFDSGDQIDCDGIFFIKDTTPIASLIYGLEMDGRSIKVNRSMETNIKGIFAAGDCTGKPLQVSKAVGEGNIAALQAVKLL